MPRTRANRHVIGTDQNAVETWNYLRLSIVAGVVGLGAAVLFELYLAPSHCLEQSISAYFFTPARGIFTGALISIGVSLLCLRGSTVLENLFLNLAGVFAPLVALIPTPSGGDPSCASYPGTAGGRVEGYANAMVAVFVVSGLLIAGVACRLIASRVDKERETILQLIGALALWLLALYLFAEQRKFFDSNVHFTSAVLMFTFAAVVIFLNTFDSCHPAWNKTRIVYLSSLCAMVLAAAIIGGLHLFDGWTNHWVFWIESAEIVPFAIFWATQTVHLWNEPERPPFVEVVPQFDGRTSEPATGVER